MTARPVCDRCGVVIVLGRNETRLALKWRLEEPGTLKLGDFDVLDLCPECSREFRTFMGGALE